MKGQKKTFDSKQQQMLVTDCGLTMLGCIYLQCVRISMALLKDKSLQGSMMKSVWLVLQGGILVCFLIKNVGIAGKL